AEGAERFAKVARASRLDLLEKVEHAPEAAPAAGRGQALRQPVVERLDDDAVHIDETDKGQRRRDLLGVLELRRRAEIHRQAVVDENVEMHFLFFEKQPQEKTIQPREQVPVEEAKVVADDVVAKVHELDALPAALAAPLALHAAEKNLPRHQLELLQASEELRVEQGLWLRVGPGFLYD